MEKHYSDKTKKQIRQIIGAWNREKTSSNRRQKKNSQIYNATQRKISLPFISLYFSDLSKSMETFRSFIKNIRIKSLEAVRQVRFNKRHRDESIVVLHLDVN